MRKSKNRPNKYIEFAEPFTDLSGNKFPPQVKYRIADEDNLFYYIKSGRYNIKIDKYFENEFFTVGDIIYGN